MLSQGLPGLITSGNGILRDDTQEAVTLRGVNRSGLEYTEPSAGGFLEAAQFTYDEVREIVQGWGAKVIRVPLNQDWALRGRNGHSAEAYLEALDQVISWAAEFGAYTILDLQWLDSDTVYGHTRDKRGLHENRVPPLPNPDTPVLWRTLASRYWDEPAVLFDLLNEPHDPLGDDFQPMYLVNEDGEIVESEGSFVGSEEWLPWAELLVREIRAIRPEGLILVSGVDWAFDLRDIQLDAENIVYSAHVYANRDASDWWKAIGRSQDLPVFLAEWGGVDQELDFGSALAAEARRLRLSWTAWSWVDYPPLIEAPRAPDFRPTRFGELVREELRG